MLHSQFIKFVIACSLAAGVNFLSRILLGKFMSYAQSIVLAYIFGIITAYILCRFFVFEPQKNSTLKQIIYFGLVNCFAILLTVLVSISFANYGLWFIDEEFTRLELAHFIGICAPIITSYLGHRYLSFR